MTEERLVYLQVKDTVDQLPEPERSASIKAAEELRALVRSHGPVGYMALALVGAQFAAEGTTL